MKFSKNWYIAPVGALITSAVMGLLGVPIIISGITAIAVGIGTSYLLDKFNINFFEKKQPVENTVIEEKSVKKSEIQESFETLEKTIATYNTKSSHDRFIVSDKIHNGLNDLLMIIENFINKTGSNVISRTDYAIHQASSRNSNPYETISNGIGWEGVAKDLRQFSTILSNDYLGKILSNPELVDEPELKLNDVIASAKVVINNIEDKNRDVVKYDTVIGAHNVNSLLGQKEFEGIFNNSGKSDANNA